jgi:DNA polymerase-3 subunit delta'
MESLSDRIRARAHDGASGLDRWVALLGRIEHGFARAGSLHLEPRQVVLTTARDMARVARGGNL